MSSIITGIIPSQQFEIIRDKIGLILFEELTNQYTLTSNEELNLKVYVERLVAFDKTDMPCVNVLFSGGTYNNKNTLSADGNYSFFIDVYSAAKSTTELSGDAKAAFSLQKVLGVCRAILENPQYRDLGYTEPKVSRTSIESISIQEPQNNQDATSSIMGRLVFNVLVEEDTQLLTANAIDSFSTEVKLNLTDKGYLFEIN